MMLAIWQIKNQVFIGVKTPDGGLVIFWGWDSLSAFKEFLDKATEFYNELLPEIPKSFLDAFERG